MKYLLVLVVVLVGAWLLLGRSQRRGQPPADGGVAARPKRAEPTAMVACAHCGVHLPSSEASFDAEGQPFCGDAHRALGAR